MRWWLLLKLKLGENMEDILHKYTAGELIEWLTQQDLTTLTEDEIITSPEGETTIVTKLSGEKISEEFIKYVQKYSIVKRGFTLYIHNNEQCEDIMQMKFTNETYDEVYATASKLCESLNNREINFVGKKYPCCQ